ncbi:MAG: germination protein YpeB [Firmicutes bacterium]|nr:germination protein YpeB [Bacillota bacterium]
MHRSSWVIPALGLGIVAAGLYGISEHQQNAAALAALDGAYGGALHGMVSEADQMREALGAANSIRSEDQLRMELAQAGEHAALASANAARMNTHVLAYRGLQTFFGTEHEKIGRLLAVADAGPLSPAERSQLRQLEQQTTAVTARLRGAQSNVLATGVHPSDLAMAAVRGAGRVESPTLKRLQAVDRFAEWHAHKPGALRAPQERIGMDIGSTRAKAIARETLGIGSQAPVRVSRFGAAYPQPGYLVEVIGSGGRSVTSVGVMQHSGVVISLDRAHSSGARALTMALGRAAALNFIERHAGGRVALYDEDSYGNVAAFTFVPTVRSVRLEDDPVFVKVSLVDGKVVDYDGVNLATASLPNMSLRPRLSPSAISRDIQGDVRVGPAVLAIIRIHDVPTLVWNALLERRGDTYRAWVSADTGRLEKIAQLTKAEAASTSS